MRMLFLTGDISGGEWARVEFGRDPWEDPAYFRRDLAAVAYADATSRTPLLIQHCERDLRTTVGQAEALFTVLRSLKRPVRLHARARGDPRADPLGVPFRRAENLVQVRDWFEHFLVRGERGCRRRRRTAPAANRSFARSRARTIRRSLMTIRSSRCCECHRRRMDRLRARAASALAPPPLAQPRLGLVLVTRVRSRSMPPDTPALSAGGQDRACILPCTHHPSGGSYSNARTCPITHLASGGRGSAAGATFIGSQLICGDRRSPPFALT